MLRSEAPSSHQLQEFYRSVGDLQEWLTLLQRMLSTQMVVVDDIPDIEGAMKRQQVFYFVKINEMLLTIVW